MRHPLDFTSSPIDASLLGRVRQAVSLAANACELQSQLSRVEDASEYSEWQGRFYEAIQQTDDLLHRYPGASTEIRYTARTPQNAPRLERIRSHQAGLSLSGVAELPKSDPLFHRIQIRNLASSCSLAIDHRWGLGAKAKRWLHLGPYQIKAFVGQERSSELLLAHGDSEIVLRAAQGQAVYAEIRRPTRSKLVELSGDEAAKVSRVIDHVRELVQGSRARARFVVGGLSVGQASLANMAGALSEALIRFALPAVRRMRCNSEDGRIKVSKRFDGYELVEEFSDVDITLLIASTPLEARPQFDCLLERPPSAALRGQTERSLPEIQVSWAAAAV